MKKVAVFVIIIVGLTSCLSMWEPDLSIKESFQIGNTSSQEVTLHFYENGKPKIVYAETYDQSNPIYVSRKDEKINITTLLCDSVLTLNANQTLLFYACYRQPEGWASTLRDCGYEHTTLHLFMNLKSFIGDSVTVSTANGAETPLPVQNAELWETWYDGKEYIYHHYLRIE